MMGWLWSKEGMMMCQHELNVVAVAVAAYSLVALRPVTKEMVSMSLMRLYVLCAQG